MGKNLEENKEYDKYKTYFDYPTVFLILFLIGFGLVMVYSTSAYKSSLLYGNSIYWLKKQMMWAAVGIAIMFGISAVDYKVIRNAEIIYHIGYLGSLILLLVTFVIGSETNGSKRWIHLGPVSFQPSEAVKVFLILFFAKILYGSIKSAKTLKGMAWAVARVFPLIVIVGIENASTAIVMMAIIAIMLFVASPYYKIFIAMAMFAVLAVIGIITIAPYRLERINVWLNVMTHDKGHQTRQGLYAIGSGGLFGKGLGQSMQKMGFLPEPHNDMIFSIICEELGLFGAICLILLFVLLIWRFLFIAINAPDLYGTLVVTGVIAQIGVQVIINIAVVTNTFPNTGIPLPFISYGGSSLVFLLSEIGIVLSVSKQIKTARY